MKTRDTSRRGRRATPVTRVLVIRSLVTRSLIAAGAAWGLLPSGAAQADLLREDFSSGIPAAWSHEDYRLGSVGQPSGLAWGLTSAETYDNVTGGSGLAAMADSDSPGDGIEYDVALLTPVLALPNEAGLTLSFHSNYQNLAGSDFADVDIRAGSGAWVNLLRWNEDHGDSFGNPVGEFVTLPLDQYAGQEVQIRFHYYDPNQNDWNWYWQVDDVVVTPAPGAVAVGVIAAGGLLRRRRRGC